MEFREVYAIKCYHCGDVYAYYPKGFEDDCDFLNNYTKCWSCGKLYAPCVTFKKMDEFVFNALKRCKM